MHNYANEAFAYWRASRAAHGAFYDGGSDGEAIDDLDLIAQQSGWEPVKARCRGTVARMTHQAIAAVATA